MCWRKPNIFRWLAFLKYQEPVTMFVLNIICNNNYYSKKASVFLRLTMNSFIIQTTNSIGADL